MSDFASNPVHHLTIAGLGRIVRELSPFGSISVQVKSTTGLKFKVYGTNDEGPQKVNFTPVAVALTTTGAVTGMNPGDEVTPGQYDVVDAVFGNFKFWVIDVTAGTGEVSVALGNGVKLI